MHTHAQDILLFPDDAAHVRPGPGFLIPLTGRNGFKWYGPREGRFDDMLYKIFRKRHARETLSRNAMASVGALKEGMKEFDIARSVVLPVEPKKTPSRNMTIPSVLTSIRQMCQLAALPLRSV